MRIFQFYLHIPFLCFLLYNKEKSGFVSNWEKGGFSMKNLRRMLACGLLFSQLFCGQAWAAEVHTPCYRSSVDTENSDFDKGDWKYKFTADFGQEAVLKDGEKHTFLIINGGLSAEHIIIENGRAFMELGALCDALGLQREEVKDAALYGKTICVENEIYVPVRAFATQLGATVTYGMQEVMPMGNPCINLDNRAQKITKEAAVQNVKEKLQIYYPMFQKSESYQKLTPYVGEMQTEFQKLQCVDETASFWVIKGVRLFLVDKATGEIYYKLGESNTGSGSYIETVGKLEETYENLFENMLLCG